MRGSVRVRRCLRLPAYRNLLAAYVFNELSWSVGTLALAVLVYRRTGSAIGSAGFFLCSQFVPALLSPALVARLDRDAPRRVLPALYAIEAVVFAVLAWFSHAFILPAVLVLTVLDGVFAGTARSLAAAARADILKQGDLLHEGNALANFGFSLAYMGGPVIGGAVVALGGTIAALLVNCGLFAVIALVLSLTALPDARPEPGTALARLISGIRHARSDRMVSRLLAIQTVAFAVFTVTIPVEVVYAQHTLHAGPGGYGALMGVWGGGAVAGSAIYARWRRCSATALITGSALSLTVGFAVVAAAPSLIVALIGMALGGIGNGIEAVAAKTILQERTPDRWMALTMSLSDSLSQVAPGLGILAGGVIAAVANPRVAFAVAAGGSLLFAIGVPLALRRVELARTGGAGSRAATAAE